MSGLQTGASSLYLGVLALYLLSWLVALAGLAASQYRCDDYGAFEVVRADNNSLLAPEVGDDCDRLFRFPWFVLAAGVLPFLADAIGRVKPKSLGVRTFGAGAPLLAFIAVLDVLMANLFYNLVDQEDIHEEYNDRFKVALAGFAGAGAMALLAMILAPLQSRPEERELPSFTTTRREPLEKEVIVTSTQV